MHGRDGGSEAERQGPAPSVGTALLVLGMWTVVAIFSGFTAFVDPTESAVKPLLIGLIFVPVLFGWGFWVRHRQHPQLLFILALVFVAVQFFSALSQVALSSDDPRRTPVFAQWAALTAGAALVGGLISLWFQLRRAKKG